MTLSGDLVDKLKLPMMVPANQSPFGTGFTVSIEARTGLRTGISAADRARTIAAAVAPNATPYDISGRIQFTVHFSLSEDSQVKR